MEHTQSDSAQSYIDAVHAAKKRNLIIAAVVIVLLAVIMVPKLLGGSEPEYLEESQVPAALILTDAEKALAGTILEPDTFRKALTYDAIGTTTYTLEEVADIIAPVIPEVASINRIGVQGAVIFIDYDVAGQRIVLEYVDPDRSGVVDQIRKRVFAEKCYMAAYNVAAGETKYSLIETE